MKLGNKNVYIYGNTKWDKVLYFCCREEILPELKHFSDTYSVVCAAWSPVDWNAEYTPWPAPKLFNKADPFTGQGRKTLHWMQETLFPYIRSHYNIFTQGIIGYSLGGLFALWVVSQTDMMYAMSCSGSLWYDHWITYLKENPMQNKTIYLSLGDKEDKTRNQRLKMVEKQTAATAQFLEKKNAITYEMNPGTHFQNVNQRIEKAIQWWIRKVD